MRPVSGLPVVLAAALFLLVSAVWAAGVPTDAVLVIDSSGSMKRTDPQRLRVPAARLFVRLLGAEDRVGVISFSDAGYPVVHLTPVDSGHLERIEQGIGKVSARGAYTNLHDAVETGLEMLEKEGDRARRRLLLLLSDGHMDTGDAERDRRLEQALFEELVPRLKTAGVRVHTIAFTEASDLDLLARLAHATGGISRMASNDRQLHQVFSDLFETAKSPDMLPIENGEFLVDDAVSEFTVVASKARPDTRIVLEMPDGRRVAAINAGRAVRWLESDSFDMITVKGPPPGTWRLLAAEPGAGNRAYVVTDLGLEAALAPENPSQGDILNVQAWLTQGDARLTRPEVLAATGFSAEILPEQGEPVTLPLADSGVAGDEKAGDARYANRLPLEQAGPYRIRVRAVSETFRREKVLHLDVVPAPASGADAGHVAETSREVAQEAASSPAASGEPASSRDPVAAAPPQEEVSSPPELEEELLPPEPDSPVSFWTVLGLFLLFNVLIGGGIGAYLFYRRRSKRGGDQEDPADLSWIDDVETGESGQDAHGPEEAADAGEEAAAPAAGEHAATATVSQDETDDAPDAGLKGNAA